MTLLVALQVKDPIIFGLKVFKIRKACQFCTAKIIGPLKFKSTNFPSSFALKSNTENYSYVAFHVQLILCSVRIQTFTR